MLPAATDRILALPDEALVLDVGGWAAPFNRADWVIDAMPFETRGQMGFSYGGDRERFGADTWVARDVCAREPWPFPDDRFDLAMCVTTLEDLRDPVWVVQEMSRIARAGYLEVPTVLGELVWRLPGEGPYLGNRHHHWFCMLEDDPDDPMTVEGAIRSGGSPSLTFVHKQHAIHNDPTVRVTPSMAAELELDEMLQGLFWTGDLPVREQLLIGETLHGELRARVAERFPATTLERRLRRVERAVAGRGAQAVGPLRRAVGAGLRRRRGGAVAVQPDVDDRHLRLGLGRPRDE
ncbi:MAG: methyltransferase domain-containing protein [Solirubrobacteraceae bacterium]